MLSNDLTKDFIRSRWCIESDCMTTSYFQAMAEAKEAMYDYSDQARQ